MQVYNANSAALRNRFIGLMFLLGISYPILAETIERQSENSVNNHDQRNFDQLERWYAALGNLLQMFYKVDGNLPKLNPSKLKRLKHLEMKSAGDLRHDGEIQELYGDPDAYIYRLRKATRKAIEALEKFNGLHSAESDEKLVQSFIAAIGASHREGPIQANPFKLISELMDLQDVTVEALEEQEACLDYLVTVKAADRISSTGIQNTQDYYFINGIRKVNVSQILRHHIETLRRASVFPREFYF